MNRLEQNDLVEPLFPQLLNRSSVHIRSPNAFQSTRAKPIKHVKQSTLLGVTEDKEKMRLENQSEKDQRLAGVERRRNKPVYPDTRYNGSPALQINSSDAKDVQYWVQRSRAHGRFHQPSLKESLPRVMRRHGPNSALHRLRHSTTNRSRSSRSTPTTVVLL